MQEPEKEKKPRKKREEKLKPTSFEQQRDKSMKPENITKKEDSNG